MPAAMTIVSLSMNQGCGPLRLSRRARAAASLMTVESLRDLHRSPVVVVSVVGASGVARTMARLDKARSDAQVMVMQQTPVPIGESRVVYLNTSKQALSILYLAATPP